MPTETSEMFGLAKAMDNLWFFRKNPPPEITKTPLPTTESPDRSSFNTQDESSSQDSDGNKRYIRRGKSRRHSSSPAKPSGRRLKRSGSCGDAELEEVKGFMDLGFDFKRGENPSDHLVRLIPGLRRISDYGSKCCSPLMDLRGERGLVVKSQLKLWARTVALVVQQDSCFLCNCKSCPRVRLNCKPTPVRFEN